MMFFAIVMARLDPAITSIAAGMRGLRPRMTMR